MVVGYSTLRYLLPLPRLDPRYLYAYGALSGLLNLVHSSMVVYRNKAHGCHWTTATFRRDGRSVHAIVRLSRPLRVSPGQYVQLWVPRVQLLSSHPFAVLSSSTAIRADTLEFLIEPRKGFTRRLWRKLDTDGVEVKPGSSVWVCSKNSDSECTHWAMYTGPHGQTVDCHGYSTVFLVASGFGIVPILTYLNGLARRNPLSCTRRIRLVWVQHGLG